MMFTCWLLCQRALNLHFQLTLLKCHWPQALNLKLLQGQCIVGHLVLWPPRRNCSYVGGRSFYALERYLKDRSQLLCLNCLVKVLIIDLYVYWILTKLLWKKGLSKTQSSFISPFNAQTLLMRCYHISSPDDEILSLVHFKDLSSYFPPQLSHDCLFNSLWVREQFSLNLVFRHTVYCCIELLFSPN